MTRETGFRAITAAALAALLLGTGCAARRGPSAAQLAVESSVNKAEEASKIAQDAALKAQQAATRAEAAARAASQPSVDTGAYIPPSTGGASYGGGASSSRGGSSSVG